MYVNIECIFGVNVWFWPRMFFDESGELYIPSVDNHGVLFALVCVFCVNRVRVGVSIENAILCA